LAAGLSTAPDATAEDQSTIKMALTDLSATAGVR
jgi:hypothetical protein